MTHADQERLERRVLVLAPTRRDAALAQPVLNQAGVDCHICSDLEQVCAELDVGAEALLLAEEVVLQGQLESLSEWLRRQPQWSDLPVMILARPGADSVGVARAMDLLGNVTVLERPMRVAALVSAVRSALRARERQYQIRGQLAEQDRALETQALLGAIVASSNDAIISKTLQGTVLTWNAGAERIFGYTAAEMIGQPIMRLIPAELSAEEPALLERLARGERIEHFETIRVGKNGKRIEISLSVSPVRDAHGNVVAASKVARDITKQKEAEAALRDADRRKDEFLAILAHELRNPLAPIRNSLHILRLAAHNNPTAERVSAMMERQVNHIVRLVEDLVDMSRVSRGKIELRIEEVEVAAVVRGAVETSRPLIEGLHHTLIVDIPPDPLTLNADPVRLTQIIANLLNNAAKYTPEGGQIHVRARREGDRVSISVRDNGSGIAPESLPRVFEMFTQLDRSSSRVPGGLGIGLTLVKSLVELHGGTVQAFSEGPGKGSEFIVHLPLAARTPTTDETALEDGPSQHLPPRRILVVDDNRDAAESLGMLLRLLGAEVQIAYNGPEALAALDGFRPDVVLLDIGMPGMDGYEVARQIRERPELHGVMLIALTGWGQEEARRRSRMAGFDYHLIKPADVSALETLLMTLGGQH